MKIFPKPTYVHKVRVEIKNIKTGEIRSVSFCETTWEEVIQHVNSKVKAVKRGIKVRINIRLSDREKRWVDTKDIRLKVSSLDLTLKRITKDIPVFDWPESKK